MPAEPPGAKKRPPERPRPRGAKDTILFRERWVGWLVRVASSCLKGAKRAPRFFAQATGLRFRRGSPGTVQQTASCRAAKMYSKRAAWASMPAVRASWSAGARLHGVRPRCRPVHVEPAWLMAAARNHRAEEWALQVGRKIKAFLAPVKADFFPIEARFGSSLQVQVGRSASTRATRTGDAIAIINLRFRPDLRLPSRSPTPTIPAGRAG